MGDTGLQYTFNNTYAEAAATLQDGSALFITTNTPDSFILGDFNGDEMLDVLDVVGLVNAVLSGGYSAPGDMNQDGVCDILDIVMLVNIILGLGEQNPSADLNNDGLYNVLDVVILVTIIVTP